MIPRVILAALGKAPPAPKPKDQKLSREERLAICSACEHCSKRATSWRCMKCGCICQFKASIPAAACPINKW